MNTLSSMLKFLGETLGANPSTLKTTNKTLVGAINSAWELVYPVGSYYETSDASFNPNTAWGGMWSLEESGKVHIGAGTGYTIGATGGATSVTSGSTTLTVNQIPAHSHYIAAQSISILSKPNSSGTGSSDLYYSSGTQTKTLTLNAHYTNNTGGSGGHTHGGISTMQPYIVVNRWHRTA